MKKRIYNLIIIDESGSMVSIKQEAMDGVNETIQTIRSSQKKHEDQEHMVTIVSFNDEMKTVCDCVSADQAVELSDERYQPNCCTALYDAMGLALNKLRKIVAPDAKVLVTIVTDGYENASREYDSASISALVKECKDKGWVFAYIGANHDVENAASAISIRNVFCFNSTGEGTRQMMRKENLCRKRLYDVMSEGDFDSHLANENFFESV